MFRPGQLDDTGGFAPHNVRRVSGFLYSILVELKLLEAEQIHPDWHSYLFYNWADTVARQMRSQPMRVAFENADQFRLSLFLSLLVMECALYMGSGDIWDSGERVMRIILGIAIDQATKTQILDRLGARYSTIFEHQMRPRIGKRKGSLTQEPGNKKKPSY